MRFAARERDWFESRLRHLLVSGIMHQEKCHAGRKTKILLARPDRVAAAVLRCRGARQRCHASQHSHLVRNLAKPSWTPPNWLFGPVWSCLYLGMAVAAWLVWRQGSGFLPMALFATQLLLNAAWSWLFFALHIPGVAFVEIVLLWAAIAATTIVFWRRSILAGLLFVPYWAWVSYASVLNFSIWRLNT